MRYAHLADCHIGSWRDPKLKDISTRAFQKAIDICLEKKTDFIIISGDLFNTALPSLDLLKDTVKKLKELKDADIPVYMIAGSHDYSPSGKSMIEVIEKAGLIINVAKGEERNNKLCLKMTEDPKTGVKIVGMLGKKGGLETEFYKSLSKKELEEVEGYKIFMFHSLISEFKPVELKDVDAIPLSYLPRNFNYYAGGHPHFVMNQEEKNYGNITYPGPLFPNSFSELEKLKKGGFYIIDIEDIHPDGKTDILTSIKWEPVELYKVHSISIDAKNKTPERVENDLKDEIKGKDFRNTIVTIRIAGTLSSGKPSDINFRSIFDKIYSKNAYFVMKNTNKLSSKEFKEISVEITSVEEIEENIIKEHLQQIKVDDLSPEKETTLTKDLMKVFSAEKQEGETSSTFEDRIKSELNKIIEL